MARDSAAPEGPCAGAGAPAGRPTSGELPDDPVLAALAPALRAALRYARMSPVAAPPTLRDLTRLDRDSEAVLAIARSAVEADDGFRAAVAATTTEAEVGDTGWAWLLRSPGWDERLIEVVLAGRRATGDRDRDRDERSSARRLEAAERRLAAAEVARTDAESRFQQVEEERRAADAATARWRQAHDELERRLVVLRNRLAAALGDQQRAEAQLGEERAARRQAEARLTDLGDRLERAEQRAQLASHLARDERGTGRPQRAEPAREGQRLPVRLQQGRREDTPDGAAALLAWPDAVVLVDGYNVSMQGWPALEARDQRTRLVDALDGWCRQRGATATVVFDGADVETWRTHRRVLTHVEVTFSADGVEADDDILRQVRRIPTTVPVVVVSTDGRVRSGAAAMGANVVRSADLLALLGAPSA